MNPYQEFWDELENEIGHLQSELNKISTQLSAIDKQRFVRHFAHLEFHSHRQTLVEKVNAIEKSILDLQQWINAHDNSAGAS